MKDILNREIVGYEEAVYLKEMGFNNECTGYYHCDDYDETEYLLDDERYECVGWRGLFRNSFSISRAAAPTIRAAKSWYTKNHVKPFVPPLRKPFAIFVRTKDNKTLECSYLPQDKNSVPYLNANMLESWAQFEHDKTDNHDVRVAFMMMLNKIRGTEF